MLRVVVACQAAQGVSFGGCRTAVLAQFADASDPFVPPAARQRKEPSIARFGLPHAALDHAGAADRLAEPDHPARDAAAAARAFDATRNHLEGVASC